MPAEGELGKAYNNYYTHRDAAAPPATPLRLIYRQMKAGYLAGKYGYAANNVSVLFRFLGLIFYLAPGRRASLDASVFHLSVQRGARLLEVGCGNGSAMRRMADLGWDVEGVDFDEKSVRNARSKGLAQEFESGIFDAVVMSHLIEHVPSPLRVLQESYRILKPGGVLVVLTPNTASLGHLMYGRSWRGLEPPRHLHLFNVKSLRNIALEAKFYDVTCRSSVRARKIFLQSRMCARDGAIDLERQISVPLRLWAVMMEVVEGFVNVFVRNVGEELKLTAKRHA
jgi:SAM-dependent methyltransferase